MVGHEPDEKRGGQNRSDNQERQLQSSPRISETEKEEEAKDNAQRHEGVNMEERHGGVEREFHPPRKRPCAGLGFVRGGIEWKVLCPPMNEQKKPNWNREKQPALRNQHR